MDRVVRLLLWVLLIISFFALVFALTDIWPGNPLKEYKFLIVIAFITLGGFTRLAMKRKTKTP